MWLSTPRTAKDAADLSGDIDSCVATREILCPSLSHTLGTNPANSSQICWKVLPPADPWDHARGVGFTLLRRRTLVLSGCRPSQDAVGVVIHGEVDGLIVAAACGRLSYQISPGVSTIAAHCNFPPTLYRVRRLFFTCELSRPQTHKCPVNRRTSNHH